MLGLLVMNDPFLKLQTATLKAIAESPLNDSEIGLLWADLYGGTPRTLAQRVTQWRSYGLPQSIAFLVQLLDILGYEWTITKKKEESPK